MEARSVQWSRCVVGFGLGVGGEVRGASIEFGEADLGSVVSPFWEGRIEGVLSGIKVRLVDLSLFIFFVAFRGFRKKLPEMKLFDGLCFVVGIFLFSATKARLSLY